MENRDCELLALLSRVLDLSNQNEVLDWLCTPSRRVSRVRAHPSHPIELTQVSAQLLVAGG